MSSSFLANAPGLGVNYSLYAVPVGWLVSYVLPNLRYRMLADRAARHLSSGLLMLPTRPVPEPTTMP
jgi:hypothetical protein